jgi:hypothetical protein
MVERENGEDELHNYRPMIYQTREEIRPIDGDNNTEMFRVR